MNIKLDLSPQCIAEILNSLQIYNQFFVEKNCKNQINEYIDLIINQLKSMNISVNMSNNDKLSIGNKVKFDDQYGILLGVGDDVGFVKVVTKNLEIIELPKILIEKIDL